jgi:hypothetical protein
MTHDRLEVGLHQPLLDQRALREGAPDLFRRMRHHPFDDEGARGGGELSHWVHPLQQGFEAIEAVAPEGAVEAHLVDQRRQALRPGGVVGLAPLAPVVNQAGKLENARVLGDRRLRDPGTVGQGPHGLFAVAGEPLEDRPAGRIGERSEKLVRRNGHVQFITCEL